MFLKFIFLVIISAVYADYNTRINKLRIPLRKKFISPTHDLETYYSTNIQVGTPAENFTVLVNFKSSDLWVLSARCKNGTFCDNPVRSKFYEPASSTFRRDPTYKMTTLMDYKFMHVSGRKANESFQLGRFKIDGQNFLLADYVDLTNNTMYYPGMEGMLGLGFKSNAKLGTPLHYAIFNKTTHTRQVFSLRLYNYPKDGYLIFGIDDYLYKGGFSLINMTSDKEYMFKAKSFQISDDEIGTNVSVKLDLGSSYISVPSDAYGIIISKLIGPREYFPDLTIRVGLMVYTLTYLDYTFMVGSDLHIMFSKTNDEWILGDPFFNKYYTIFDIEHKVFGFAEGV